MTEGKGSERETNLVWFVQLLHIESLEVVAIATIIICNNLCNAQSHTRPRSITMKQQTKGRGVAETKFTVRPEIERVS